MVENLKTKFFLNKKTAIAKQITFAKVIPKTLDIYVNENQCIKIKAVTDPNKNLKITIKT